MLLPAFVWVISPSKYKAMRVRTGSKSFRLMPVSLNIIKLQFISTNTCASASKKPGDFIALIKALRIYACLLPTENPKEPK